MKTTTNITYPAFALFAFAWFALSPQARAVTPPRDGGYANENTPEGEDELFSLTTDADNTAMGFDAMYSNTTGFYNALASWSWTHTGTLNTGRFYHTVTLLQKGMVLVAAGYDTNLPGHPWRAELGHRHR